MTRLNRWGDSIWSYLRYGYDNRIVGYWNDYSRYTRFAILILGSGGILGAIYLIYSKLTGKDLGTEKVRNKYQLPISYYKHAEGKPVYSDEYRDILLELRSSIVRFNSSTGLIYANHDHIFLIKSIFSNSSYLIEGNQRISEIFLAYHWNKSNVLCHGWLEGSDIQSKMKGYFDELRELMRGRDTRVKKSSLTIEDKEGEKDDFIEIGWNDEYCNVSLAKIQFDWVIKVYEFLTSQDNRTDSIYASRITDDREKILDGLNQIKVIIDAKVSESKSQYIRDAMVLKTLLFESPMQNEDEPTVLNLQSRYIDMLQYLHDWSSSVLDKSKDVIRRKILYADEIGENNLLHTYLKNIEKTYDNTEYLLRKHNRLFVGFKKDDGREVYRLSYAGDTEGSKDTVKGQVQMFKEQITAWCRFVDLYANNFKENDHGEGDHLREVSKLLGNIPGTMDRYLADYESNGYDQNDADAGMVENAGIRNGNLGTASISNVLKESQFKVPNRTEEMTERKGMGSESRSESAGVGSPIDGTIPVDGMMSPDTNSTDGNQSTMIDDIIED